MSLTDSQKIDQLLARTDVLYLAVAQLLGIEKFTELMDNVIAGKTAELEIKEMQTFLSESSGQ